MSQPALVGGSNPPPPAPKKPLWKPVAVVLSVVVAASLLLLGFPYLSRMLPRPPSMLPFLGYRSEEEAREALRKNPNDAPAHMTLARAAQKRFDKVVSLREWREAARLAPNNSDFQMSLAFELLNQQKHEEARPILTAVSKKNDGSAKTAAHLLNTLSYFKTKPAPVSAK